MISVFGMHVVQDRLLPFIFVAGLMAVFVCMLTVTMVAYFKRTRQLRSAGDRGKRALPMHVVLISLAFLSGKFINFTTIWWDTVEPVRQFPFWIRIPWDAITTIIGILALKHLLTYERYKTKSRKKYEESSSSPEVSQP
jgi:hypothetical protein